VLTRPELLRVAMALSALAGVIHVLNVQEHLEEWWGYGLFFLFASGAQLYYALGLYLVARMGPSGADGAPPRGDEGFFLLGCSRKRWFQVGIAGNAAILLLYVVTRTVGIPLFGPAAGEVEPVTAIGLVSKVAEAGLIACLAALLRGPLGAPAATTSAGPG
jgi:hypothetical protein